LKSSFKRTSLKKSQNQAIAVSAVNSSGIATPFHGNIPLKVPHHKHIDTTGRNKETILNHRKCRNLSHEKPINHMANGNVMKNPRDEMKWSDVSPIRSQVSSEKTPIDVRNPAVRRKGTRAITVARSCTSFMSKNVIIVRNIPVIVRLELKINALANGYGPTSIRVQCPRSLKALSTQLKCGANTMENSIPSNAISGVKYPIRSIT
jgi:hypothetical protein